MVRHRSPEFSDLGTKTPLCELREAAICGMEGGGGMDSSVLLRM